MKCTNKITALILCLALCAVPAGCSAHESNTAAYEQEHYNKSLYRGALFARDLCVTDKDVPLDGFTADSDLHAAGLFDLKNEKVLYADKINNRLFPASTTKIMTAYLTLKYANLDDVVTVGPNAVDFAPDEQVCGLKAGDKVTVNDLLNGLLLYSGNDCAVAIAEHISGSVKAFADLMNKEAKALGATNTHFVNPHGLQNEDHYTTAYDLYLIFNACAKDQRFLDIISKKSYTGTLTGQDGAVRTREWLPTNHYSLGEETAPAGVTVFGGKTGTTDEAGACVMLYSQNAKGNPYISIVMGAANTQELYGQMSSLMSAGENKSKTPQQAAGH